ncbi:hypothetical protein ACWIGM_08175 [Bosea sp. NPDC055332]
MARDFTLKAYVGIVDAALAAGYRPMRVGDWLDGARPGEPVIILRHDVDRRPENALAMAHEEAARGAPATYYFRTVGSAFNPAIIREIAAMGHEIGYHYEDFHVAKYDPDKAHALYLRNLAALREITPVRSIAMHGSPLAKHNNMELWKHRSFVESGVKDCILSADWSQFLFFTDTGRSFDARLTNLRDTIGGKRAPGVASSAAVGEHLQTHRPPFVQLSVHPERWSDKFWAWSRQLATDTAANGVKLGLRILR